MKHLLFISLFTLNITSPLYAAEDFNPPHKDVKNRTHYYAVKSTQRKGGGGGGPSYNAYIPAEEEKGTDSQGGGGHPQTPPIITINIEEQQTHLHTILMNLDREQPIFNRVTLARLHRELNNIAAQKELDLLTSQSQETNTAAHKKLVLRSYNTRESAAEKIINQYFNEVIDYIPVSLKDFFTFQNVGIIGSLGGIHTALITAGNLYPTFAPFSGGVTLATMNLITGSIALYVKDHGWPRFLRWSDCCRPLAKHRVQKKWETRLSNPDLKTFIAKLLSYICVFKKWDASEKTIRTNLNNLFLNHNSFSEMFTGLTLN